MPFPILPPRVPPPEPGSMQTGLQPPPPAMPMPPMMGGMGDMGAMGGEGLPDEPVANTDFPPLPVPPPPAGNLGGDDEAAKQSTADMLARIIGSVGARYSSQAIAPDLGTTEPNMGMPEEQV